jgi:hypothetical protein
LLEVAFVFRVVDGPSFNTIAMLAITKPLTFILVTLEVCKLAEAIGLVIFPLANETVAISMD